MTVMKPKSMQEAAVAIRERLASLVKKEAERIKDPEQRRLFKASMLGSAHMEPGTHEPAEAGVPEHMEPGNHEHVAPSEEQPPADEAQPVAGGLGVPGGDLEGDGLIGGPENGTVDLCPLCGNEDAPGSCTCLGTPALQKMGEALGADMTGPAGPGVMDGPLMRSEPCTKCAGMHLPLNKGGKCAVKKSAEDPGTVPDPENKALPKDKAGKEIKSPGSGGDSKNKPKESSLTKGWPKDAKENRSNKAGFNIHEQLDKPDLTVHPTAGVSRDLAEKGKNLPVPAAKGPHARLAYPHTPNQASPHDKAAEDKYWRSVKRTDVKKADVPMAKPPSGKVPGGTGAPPMASNNSAPKIGPAATTAAAKPPAVPGAGAAPKLGKAALSPDVKTQMREHMMSDASKAAAKPAPSKPAGSIQPAKGVSGVPTAPLPGLVPSGGRAATPNVPAGKGASIPGFSPGATGGVPGGTFQPQPVKVPAKPAGLSAPGPAAPAPKRSLFTALFGPKR